MSKRAWPQYASASFYGDPAGVLPEQTEGCGDVEFVPDVRLMHATLIEAMQQLEAAMRDLATKGEIRPFVRKSHVPYDPGTLLDAINWLDAYAHMRPGDEQWGLADVCDACGIEADYLFRKIRKAWREATIRAEQIRRGDRAASTVTNALKRRPRA